MTYSSDFADLVRSHRPPTARAYFLSNYNGRFPMHGGYSMEPFEAPRVPAGSYTLGFLSSVTSSTPLVPLNQHLGAPIIPVPDGGQAMESISVKTEAAGDKPIRADRRDPITDHPGHLTNRVEYEQIRMADETVRSKHLLGKNLGQIEDMAATLLYAKAWRQEGEQVIRAADQERRLLTDELLRLTNLIVHERTGQRPQAAPDPTTSTLSFLGQVIGLIGAAVSPAIAKHQREKHDPILDAFLHGTEEENQSPDSPSLATLKKEIDKAKTELEEAKKRAQSPVAKSAIPPKAEPKQAPPVAESNETQLATLIALHEELGRKIATLKPVVADLPIHPTDGAKQVTQVTTGATKPASQPRPKSSPRANGKMKAAPKALPAKKAAK